MFAFKLTDRPLEYSHVYSIGLRLHTCSHVSMPTTLFFFFFTFFLVNNSKFRKSNESQPYLSSYADDVPYDAP